VVLQWFCKIVIVVMQGTPRGYPRTGRQNLCDRVTVMVLQRNGYGG
jgi:hypothetical protein